MEAELGRALRARGWRLAVAESCTGGLLGARITSVGGSSDYFAGGIISYSNAVKVRCLGVDERILAAEGAVSEPVARQMAQGVCRELGADVGVGITGIAGPAGGTDEKPVGLVFIGVAAPGVDDVSRCVFEGARDAVRRQAVDTALKMVLDRL
jgi:PncC family amidohydrolase